MRNKIFGRQLSRNRKSREALFRSLIRELLLKGSIETTLAKAKSIQGDVDGIMKLVSNDSLAARRTLLSRFANNRELVEHAYKTYGSTAKERVSGYTSIVKLAPRRGDNAQIARIEFVQSESKKAVSEVKPVKTADAS